MSGGEAVRLGLAAKLQVANGHVNTRKVAHGSMASEGLPAERPEAFRAQMIDPLNATATP